MGSFLMLLLSIAVCQQCKCADWLQSVNRKEHIFRSKNALGSFLMLLLSIAVSQQCKCAELPQRVARSALLKHSCPCALTLIRHCSVHVLQPERTCFSSPKTHWVAYLCCCFRSQLVSSANAQSCHSSVNRKEHVFQVQKRTG